MIRKIEREKGNSTYNPIPPDTIQDGKIEYWSKYENMKKEKEEKKQRLIKPGLVVVAGENRIGWKRKRIRKHQLA